MKKTWRWLILVMPLWLGMMLMLPPTAGQIVVPGKDPKDKVLSAFWSQNGNANTTVVGLNANASTKIASAILDPILSAKIFTGAFDGTNRFLLRVWDTNSAVLQTFEFTLNGGTALGSNGVSRVGFPEPLSYKTLNNWKASTNGTAQTGVMVARGTEYGMAVAGKSGTNRIYLQHEWSWATPANYLEFREGVLTAGQ